MRAAHGDGCMANAKAINSLVAHFDVIEFTITSSAADTHRRYSMLRRKIRSLFPMRARHLFGSAAIQQQHDSTLICERGKGKQIEEEKRRKQKRSNKSFVLKQIS